MDESHEATNSCFSGLSEAADDTSLGRRHRMRVDQSIKRNYGERAAYLFIKE